MFGNDGGDGLMNKNWYILFVKSGTELDTCRIFENEKDVVCFVPKKEALYRTKGKKRVMQKPLFPGYLFFQSSLDRIEFSQFFYRYRQDTSNLLKEIRYDEDIPALTQEEEEMLESLLNHEKVLVMSKGVIDNDQVIITEGPLCGYESKIIHIDRHKREAEMQVSLCNRLTTVKVPLEIVKKI